MRIAKVLLAAGQSSRFDGCKLIANVGNNKTMIARAVDVLQQLDAGAVYVVSVTKGGRFFWNRFLAQNVAKWGCGARKGPESRARARVAAPFCPHFAQKPIQKKPSTFSY